MADSGPVVAPRLAPGERAVVIVIKPQDASIHPKLDKSIAQYMIDPKSFQGKDPTSLEKKRGLLIRLDEFVEEQKGARPELAALAREVKNIVLANTSIVKPVGAVDRMSEQNYMKLDRLKVLTDPMVGIFPRMIHSLNLPPHK